MKQLSFLFLSVIFLLSSCHTDPDVTRLFKQYAGKEGVVSVTIPGWAIRMGASLGDLSPEERHLLRSVKRVKVLTIENDQLNAKVNFHDEYHSKLSSSKNYETLVVIRDEGEQVSIFSKGSDEVIKEMIVLVGGDENVLVYIKGNITQDLIKQVVRESGKEYRFTGRSI